MDYVRFRGGKDIFRSLYFYTRVISIYSVPKGKYPKWQLQERENVPFVVDTMRHKRPIPLVYIPLIFKQFASTCDGMLYIEHTHVTRVRVCLHFARLLFQHRKIIKWANWQSVTTQRDVRPPARRRDRYLFTWKCFLRRRERYVCRTMNNAIRAALCICTWGKIFGSW